MKYTKEIIITNIYNEEVTIKPIEYSMAIKVIELMEEKAILIDNIGKLFVKLFDNNEDIHNNEEFQKLNDKCDKMEQQESQLRNKYNYWYCGLDNLDKEDKERLLRKYPRRNK